MSDGKEEARINSNSRRSHKPIGIASHPKNDENGCETEFFSGLLDVFNNPWCKPFEILIVDSERGPRALIKTQVPFPEMWTTITLGK